MIGRRRFQTCGDCSLLGAVFETTRAPPTYIKCQSPRHPPVFCLLYGSGKFPNRSILRRNEVTKGWKEVRWNLRRVDLGTSKKNGPFIHYLRIWTTTDQFRPKDTLDLYLDNVRLVTREAPLDLTGKGTP